jgi:hypothetical protein
MRHEKSEFYVILLNIPHFWGQGAASSNPAPTKAKPLSLTLRQGNLF